MLAWIAIEISDLRILVAESAGCMVWYMVVLVSGLDAKPLKTDKIVCLIINLWPVLGFSV